MPFVRSLFFFLSLYIGVWGSMANTQDSLATQEKEVKLDHAPNLDAPTFNGETLRKFKEDDSFDYSEKPVQTNWWQKFKNWLWDLWLKFWIWLVGDYQSNGIVAFLVKTLPYLIIGGIVLFIGWLFYRLNPGTAFFGTREKPELFFSEEEEIIRKKNISELMDRALLEKNYRLAVRYYYLLILQKLAAADIISYEADKTNSEYISEINSETLKAGFRKATNVYDHVWYGNFEVTESDFEKAQPTFVSLKNKIQNQVA